MKLEKIDRLFAAYTSNTPATQTKSTEEVQIQAATAQVEEAVKVARDFGTQSSEVDREEKLARIKAQVDSKTYNVDSKELAKSLIRDLFV